MQVSLSASVAALEELNARLEAELAAEREENNRLRTLIETCDDEDPGELAAAIERARAAVDLLSDSQRVRTMTVEEALDLIEGGRSSGTISASVGGSGSTA